LDILSHLEGGPSYRVLKDAAGEPLEIDGVPVTVASLDHLIAMKEAAGRTKEKLMATEYRVLSDELRASRQEGKPIPAEAPYSRRVAIRGGSSMRARRIRFLPLAALVAVVVAGAGAGIAAVRAAVTVKAAQNTTLSTKILVNQGNRTLYHLTTEKGKKFTCTGTCATFWPPLTVAKGAKPKAGPGITKSKLGTIKRPDGRIQVTYAGLTLYRYSGDSKAGQTNGEGVQNIWYAIGSTGKLVKGPSSGGYGGYGP
jgi:predicted lipoprotein with Yx(FWY)xxD motif